MVEAEKTFLAEERIGNHVPVASIRNERVVAR
jgi:hypothetical protein